MCNQTKKLVQEYDLDLTIDCQDQWMWSKQVQKKAETELSLETDLIFVEKFWKNYCKSQKYQMTLEVGSVGDIDQQRWGLQVSQDVCREMEVI